MTAIVRMHARLMIRRLWTFQYRLLLPKCPVDTSANLVMIFCSEYESAAAASSTIIRPTIRNYIKGKVRIERRGEIKARSGQVCHGHKYDFMIHHH
jgi:hypothetical protein